MSVSTIGLHDDRTSHAGGCLRGRDVFKAALAETRGGLCLSAHVSLLPCLSCPGYGVEHAQCVPPSEYSEPGFITESYQTLHPISSEELLTLKYESEYPAVILRDASVNPLPGGYFSVKQEVVSPDNMCVGRLSRGEGGAGRVGCS